MFRQHIDKYIMKTCKDCGNTAKHSSAYCSTCHYTRYQKTDKAKKDAHWRHLKACYGITKDEYTTLHESQGGLCAICGQDPIEQGYKKKNLSVDHQHGPADTARGTTDKTTIRGLLCVNCNQGLGGFRDNPAWLIKAVEYLNSPRPFSQSSAE